MGCMISCKELSILRHNEPYGRSCPRGTDVGETNSVGLTRRSFSFLGMNGRHVRKLSSSRHGYVELATLRRGAEISDPVGISPRDP